MKFINSNAHWLLRIALASVFLYHGVLKLMNLEGFAQMLPISYTEVVLVVFDPTVVSFEQLLQVFWESHNPTQGMRQGNDVGTQYRSAIFTHDNAQHEMARRSLSAYQAELSKAGHADITTEILPLDTFYYAEDYHQQYLAKNPDGYCGIGGTGVSCPVGFILDQQSA